MTVSRPIPTRRMQFESSLADLPVHYAGDGDLFMSHIVAMASGVFPDGEDFFVRSVRHYRDRIDDPELKAAMAGFIGQEAMHGREHRTLNDRLDELGYPTKRVERFTKWGLRQREKYLPPMSNLAATAALEHYTATLAEILLADPEAQRRIGNPAVLDILLWHALEENEHKAVAFDVYKAMGGSERLRTFTMNVVTVGFIGGMIVQSLISMMGDRTTWTSKEALRSLRRIKGSPFVRKEVWQRLRDYNRPDFHPDDHDTAELLARWRDELFGSEGTLNDRLSRPAPSAA